MRSLYDKLSVDSPVAVIIISVSLMLFLGFAMTRVTKKLKLPNVTAYIITGILIGPFCLDLIDTRVISGMEFLSDIAIAFIAFGTGQFFRFDALKKNGAKVIVITLFEALTASIVIFCTMYFVLGLSFAFSIVLAAIASTTTPASTMMTIRQTGSKGDFVDTLLQVIAIDEMLGLIAYSVTISIASATINGGESVSFIGIVKPFLINMAVLLLGGLFGILLKLLMPKTRTNDNRLIISIATLMIFCGICSMIGVSPLLGCMSMGAIYINITDDDKLFMQLNYFNPPILLLFFVRSGLSFDFGVLFGGASSVGSVSLVVVGLTYVFVRIGGKYLGAFCGCAMVKKSNKIRNHLGLALIPQTSIAIGLAAVVARTLGGETGIALNTVILASSVLYELIGPACAKLGLYLSGSYSGKIEDIVTVDNIDTETGKEKTEVEKLIERIRSIEKTLPPADVHTPDENEQAFNEAAEEQYALAQSFSHYRTKFRR